MGIHRQPTLMEAITRILAEARTHRDEKNPQYSYYKHLDAALLSIAFVSDNNLMLVKGGMAGQDVQKILEIAEKCMDRARDELPAVLDLSEDEADAAHHKSIMVPSKSKEDGRDLNPLGLGLVKAEPYQFSGQCTPSKSSPKMAATEIEALYGPEPALNSYDDTDLPMIPTSCLSLSYCQSLYELQIAVQKADQFSNATAKQRGNAIFLDSLSKLISLLKGHAQVKVDWDVKLKTANSIKIRNIPPVELARQITLIQMQLFKLISEEELRMPQEECSYLQTPNLLTFQALSSYLSHWCQYEVLRYERVEDRAAVFGHFIKTANHLQDLGNFDGLKMLVAGMTASPVHRLRQTLEVLPKKLRTNLEMLSLLCSERRNYAQLRDAVKKRVTPVIPSVTVWRFDQRNSSVIDSDLVRLKEMQESIYDTLYKVQPVVQHYILTQPYRRYEELVAISYLREPRASNGIKIPANLTEEEEERLAYPEGDAYDILQRRIQRPRHYVQVQPVRGTIEDSIR